VWIGTDAPVFAGLAQRHIFLVKQLSCRRHCEQNGEAIANARATGRFWVPNSGAKKNPIVFPPQDDSAQNPHSNPNLDDSRTTGKP